jgi:hypothetical protein
MAVFGVFEPTEAEMSLGYYCDVLHDCSHKDPAAKFLLLMMADGCGMNELFTPNIQKLALLTGMSEMEVKEKIKYLDRGKYIEIIREKPLTFHMLRTRHVV